MHSWLHSGFCFHIASQISYTVPKQHVQGPAWQRPFCIAAIVISRQRIKCVVLLLWISDDSGGLHSATGRHFYLQKTKRTQASVLHLCLSKHHVPICKRKSEREREI